MIVDLINEAIAANIHLYVEQDKLRFAAKKGALSVSLKARIGGNKQAIIDYLKGLDAQGLDSQQGRDDLIAKRRKNGQEVLSFSQQRLWFINQLQGDSAQYNVPSALKLEGTLDGDLLNRAVNKIIERHQILRTNYAQIDGESRQIIRQFSPMLIKRVNLSHESDEEQVRSVTRLSKTEAAKVFDLQHDLMIRVQLIELRTDCHVLLLTVHHIAFDGWSLGIVVEELTRLYQDYHQGLVESLLPLKVQFADFSLWQREQFQGESLERQLSYWRERLSGIPQVHAMPLDHPRPAKQQFSGKHYQSKISIELTAKLHQLAREHDATLFMVLQSAYALLIGRWSNADDVVIGSPIAGRDHHSLTPLIGFFVNTLVLRTQLDENSSFSQLLLINKRNILDAYSHQDISFEHLVDELNPSRNFSHTPLFQLLFVLQNNQSAAPAIDGLTISEVVTDETTVRYDLELCAAERDQQIVLDWSFATHLFDVKTIANLSETFGYLLTQLVDDPQQLLVDISLVAQSFAREEPLISPPINEAQEQPEVAVHQLFEQQVRLTPDAIAVQCELGELTYHQLNQKANALADYLSDWGIEAQALVGICVPRSTPMLIALLAVLKAGAAYVPIEPDMPMKRAQQILADSEMELLITETSSVAKLPLDGIDVILVDDAMAFDWLAEYERDDPEVDAQQTVGQSCCYVLYTSGSTGKPKGVAVNHGGVVNYIRYASENYFEDCHQGAVVSSTLSFDATITSLLPALIIGRHVTLLPSSQEALLSALTDQLIADIPLLFKLTPAHLDMLDSRFGENEIYNTRHVIVVGGEQLTQKTLSQWKLHRLPHTRFINEYGPTETVVGCSVYEVDSSQDIVLTGSPYAIPIGKAIANTCLYVFDKHRKHVPVGAIGELYIGGAGVTLGYLNLPQMTAERFIEHQGQRLYRSGDLVRLLPDGNLVFIGRIDEQVKLRGFRIELDEIRLALEEFEAVSAALVILWGSDVHKQLVAYLISPVDDKNALIEKIRLYLNQRLPQYMVPGAFVVLPDWPLTVNGKIDRKALPSPQQNLQNEFIAPTTSSEKTVSEIWTKVLKLEQPPSVNADFFSLGGNSILATKILGQVMACCEVDIQVRAVFDHATLQDFAAHIDSLDHQKFIKIKALAPDEAKPLSFAQQRLWFIDQLEGNSTQYNMPGALKLKGQLDIEALKRAVSTIIERHQVLRTVYVQRDGDLVQQVNPLAQRLVMVADLASFEPLSIADRVADLVSEQARKPFDLKNDVMLRVQLICCSTSDYVLCFTMHHIASDGWSTELLINEFVALYQAYAQGDANPLAPLSIQYSDYAHWQRQHLTGRLLRQQLDYWQQQLSDIPQLHGLGLDYVRPAQQQFAAEIVHDDIDESLHGQLQDLAQQQDVTMFMLLQSAYALLIARLSEQQDIVVGCPIAGRNHSDVEPLIGFFVNTIVLRTQVQHKSGQSQGFEQLLQANKATIVGAYAHQELSFEQLVDVVNPPRSLSHTPVFQLYFDLQQQQDNQFELADLAISQVTGRQVTIRYDLELTAYTNENGIQLQWRYATGLFKSETIVAMAQSFQRLLAQIVSQPAQLLSKFDLTPQLSARQFEQWNQTAVSIDANDLFHHRFEQCCREQPNALAISCGQQSMSYDALNQQANQMAHGLIERGIDVGTLVGVSIERSVELAVTLLAIVKCGGCYVPLSPDLPRQRLMQMIQDNQLNYVVTDSNDLADALPDNGHCLLATSSFWSEYPNINVNVTVKADDLVYMIFTSGSTGKPKGVLIEHLAMLNLLLGLSKRIDVSAGRNWLLLTPLSFDIAVFELFGGLLNRGHVVIATEQQLQPQSLNQLLNDSNIEVMQTTPARWGMMLDAGWQGKPDLVALCGGEALPPALQAKLYPKVAKLFNCYGPTEATVWSLINQVSEADIEENHVPLGQSLANYRHYVLNDALVPAPIGGIGQLYIGGDSLARGYFQLDDLSRERFVVDPFVSGHRIYQSGDLVRRLTDGRFDFIGRVDEQFKLRGFRIEPGEIQVKLTQVVAVSHAVVLLKGEAERQVLIAYIQTDRTDSDLVISRCQALCSDQLPDYMNPSVYVVMTQLPLTANGKIDRKALPEPNVQAQDQYVEPDTKTEALLAQLWQEVLDLAEPVSANANFFALGGNSLLVTRVLSLISAKCEVQVQVRALYEQDSLQALASHIDSLTPKNVSQITPLVDDQPSEVSLAQRRLWFIDKLEGGSVQYNMPSALRLRGYLDRKALELSVEALFERHQILRTVYLDQGQQVLQQVLSMEVAQTGVDYRDLSTARIKGEASNANVQQNLITSAMAEQAGIAFDLSCEVPMRVQLLKLAEDEQVLLFTLHHIASDGWSMSLLENEFVALYQAYVKSEPNPLAPLAIQYRDFSSWQNLQFDQQKIMQQQHYWQHRLADIPPVHALGLDKVRPPKQDFSGERLSTYLDESLSQRVRDFARQQDVTPYTLLQSVFALLVSRWSDESDIVIGSPVSGRNQLAIEPLVGFFVNTLVIRTIIDSDASFSQLLADNKQHILAAQANQQLPFEQLVEVLNPARSLSYGAIYQIYFSHEVSVNKVRTMAQMEVERLSPVTLQHKYDLSLVTIEQPAAEGEGSAAEDINKENRIRCNWTFATAIFERQTIALMSNAYQHLLQQVISDPQQQVSQLSLLDKTLHRQVLAQSRAPSVALDGSFNVVRLFERQVQNSPDACAVVVNGESIDYEQLNVKANKIAHALQAQGVTGECKVAVWLPRCVDLLATLFGVLKAGASYIALENSNTKERLTQIIENAGVNVVITIESMAAMVSDNRAKVLPLDHNTTWLDSQPIHNLNVVIEPQDSAYVVYTSGSTGTPKGVDISHLGLLDYCQFSLCHYYKRNNEALAGSLLVTSHGFDISVPSLFLPLLSGGTVNMTEAGLELSELVEYLTDNPDQRPILIRLTPMHVQGVVDMFTKDLVLLGEHVFVIGGENLPAPLALQLQQHLPQAQLYNHYGPSEAVVGCAMYDISANLDVLSQRSVVPIGKPMDNTSLYVLDSHKQPVPDGVVAQLYIAGPCVAKGYLNLDEVNRQVFIDNPHYSAERCYRSGDLVRRLNDGNLEYVRRADEQVKLRGFRIEPGEIQAHLRGLPQVKDARVIIDGDGQQARIVAYLVVKEADAGPKDELLTTRCRSHLAQMLPDYMQPAVYVVLMALPLSANGKVNIRQLPIPPKEATLEYAAPSDDIESQLADIWQDLLDIEQPVSVTANFFELGGHSLLANRLAGLVKQRFVLDVPLRAFFDYQEIRSLADFIRTTRMLALVDDETIDEEDEFEDEGAL